jgi:hypothetical protein
MVFNSQSGCQMAILDQIRKSKAPDE